MFILRVLTCFVGWMLIAGITYGEERSVLKPRVPADQLGAAQAMKNPIPSTPANLAKGKSIFEGKGKCFLCHGVNGDGKGSLGSAPNYSPRNFRNGDWQKARTDGELHWVIVHGVEGSWMHEKKTILTDEETWLAVLHIRSFRHTPAAGK